jgi:hypothetical protein
MKFVTTPDCLAQDNDAARRLSVFHYPQTERKQDRGAIPPGEVREIENRTNHICKMLVVIPYPAGAKP